MGYWGWRPLLAAFVSVWVAGCSATHDAAPTLLPTLPPLVTLTIRTPITATPLTSAAFPTPTTAPYLTATPVIYVLQAGDTLLSIGRQFGVPVTALEAANPGLNPRSLQIGQPIIIPNPRFDPAGSPMLPTTTPLALSLFPPTCYSTPTDTLVCLGAVHNHLPQAVTRLTVRVTLLSAGGRPLAEVDTGVEQAFILPGQAATYRALFQVGEYGGVAATLRSADTAVNAAVVTPELEAERGEWRNGRYILSATLRNTTTGPLLLQRAVATLYNRAGQITGYRVVPLDHTLAAGQSQPFTLDILPYGSDRDIRHTLYVEAQAIN